MRELTLLDTGYLAGLLLLSLVLPLIVSFRGLQLRASKSHFMRTFWLGQVSLGLLGLAVLVSSALAPYAVACGLVSCVGCALLLLRQFRETCAAKTP